MAGRVPVNFRWNRRRWRVGTSSRSRDGNSVFGGGHGRCARCVRWGPISCALVAGTSSPYRALGSSAAIHENRFDSDSAWCGRRAPARPRWPRLGRSDSADTV